MKNNYLELGPEDSVRGSYVKFVHAVIELLQQYTTDICPIDRFFTDSAAFPLPDDDPTYVVGRLKGYAARLFEATTLKQLAIFIQTISERAAFDNQQDYLVQQLCNAVTEEPEAGSAEVPMPTLQTVLVQAIFPAYIQLSIRASTGWLFAIPVLRVCSTIFGRLLFEVSLMDCVSTEAATASVTDVLVQLRLAVDLIMDDTSLLQQPHILKVLSHIFATVTPTIYFLDYLGRSGRKVDTANGCIAYFRSFGVFVAETVIGRQSSSKISFSEDLQLGTSTYHEIRQFCVRELGRDITTRWSINGRGIFAMKGNQKREVVSNVSSLEEERGQVLDAIEDFHSTLETAAGEPLPLDDEDLLF